MLFYRVTQRLVFISYVFSPVKLIQVIFWKIGKFPKNQENCYPLGTRIFKIGPEMAEDI